MRSGSLRARWVCLASLCALLLFAVTVGQGAPAANPVTIPSNVQSYAVLAGFANNSSGNLTNGGGATIFGDAGTRGSIPASQTPTNVCGTLFENLANTDTRYISARNVAGQLQSPPQPANPTNLSGQDLSGLTLTPGVYRFDQSAQLSVGGANTGILTFDAQNDPNAVFVIQVTNSLTVQGTGQQSAQVVLTNGAQACNIFWAIGNSATIGQGVQFAGNIVANNSVNLGQNAVVDGRVWAGNNVSLSNGAIVQLPCVLSVTKTPGGTVSKATDTITYDVVITNNGCQPLTIVSVIDSKAGDVTANFTGPIPANGGTISGHYSYVVQSSDPDPLVNVVTVKASYTTGGGSPVTFTFTGAAAASVDLVHPSFTVTKTAQETDVLPGGTIHYTLTITNTGDWPITVIDIKDSVKVGNGPATTINVTPLSGTQLAAAPGPGNSEQYTYSLIVPPDTTPPTTVTNGATVTVSVKDLPNTPKATSNQVVVNVVSVLPPTPSVTVTKVADTEVTKVGDCVCYTVTITNNSDFPVEITKVTDTLFSNGLPPCALKCLLGVLQPKESAQATYCYTVKPTDDTDTDPADNVYVNLTNTVAVYGCPTEDDGPGLLVDGCPQLATATEEVKIVHPCLVVTKCATSACADPGKPLTWSITVENCGDWGLENIVLKDPQLSGQYAGGILPVDSTLAAGASKTYSFTYTVPCTAKGKLKNTVFATANPVGLPNVLTATATATVKVNPPKPEICVWKTPSCDYAQAGDTIWYTITVKNTGCVPLTGVALYDPMLSCGKLYGFPTVLQPGQPYSKQFCYKVSPCDTGILTNTVTAKGYGPGACIPVCSEATATVRIIKPCLTITKTLCPTTTVAQPGKPITFAITIRNTGYVTAKNITVTDSLPGTWMGNFPNMLGPGGCATAYFTYTVPASACGTLMNTAWVGYRLNGSSCWMSAKACVMVPIARYACPYCHCTPCRCYYYR